MADFCLNTVRETLLKLFRTYHNLLRCAYFIVIPALHLTCFFRSHVTCFYLHEFFTSHVTCISPYTSHVFTLHFMCFYLKSTMFSTLNPAYYCPSTSHVFHLLPCIPILTLLFVCFWPSLPSVCDRTALVFLTLHFMWI